MDCATKRTRLDGAVAGAGFAIPIIVHDTGKGVFKQGDVISPDAFETTLVRYCALISAIASSAYSAVHGHAAVPPLGALYTDDNTLGLANNEGIYVNVRGYLTAFRAQPLDALFPAMLHMLNESFKTTLHEAAHALVDISQNHSRAFWDLHVELLGDQFLQRSKSFLQHRMVPYRADRRGWAHDDYLKFMVEAFNGPTQSGDEAESDSDDGDEDYVPAYQTRRRSAKERRKRV
jgi:hypothetical protein